MGRVGVWSTLVVGALACAVLGGPAVASPVAGSTLAVGPEVTRIQGADRFAVSAAVSAAGYDPGAPVAYVASGRVFADALAAGPVAAYLGGPILLTDTTSLPTSVRAELDRLRPRRIVVVGGPRSVSPGVEEALRRYTAGAVTRVGGADRYEVAAAVSKDVFLASSTRPQYLASGSVFTDALSASPAAGFVNAPIFLVDPQGRARGAGGPQVTTVIVGGPASVPVSLDATYSRPGSRRVAGADRFEVSANVSADTFPTGRATVYVASGRVFTDALSGAPLAASSRAPVLLVDTDEVPQPVADEIRRLAPERVVVLGGPATVSDAVLAELASL